MSLEGSQKPVNGLETPQQDPPATSATESNATDALKKTDGSDVPSSLKNSADVGKDAINGSADTETVSAGQPLEAAKPKESTEPTKPIQPEEPLPKGEPETTSASTETQDKGVSTAQETSADNEVKSAEKMDVDNAENKLPPSDPTTIGNIPAKDSEGQDVDQVKANELASVQETAKHGHDDDQAAVEEQRPAKKQRTGLARGKESNGADTTEAPKRSASKKKKEAKKATTEDGQPRRSSRFAT